MSSFATTISVIVGLFLVLMVGMNVVIGARAKAMKGKPLPDLPGTVGESIGKASSGLVYFFSPGCGACRSLTPKLSAIAKKNKNVFLIDISENLDIARAMRIMATPSTVEVASGQIVDVHIGMLPSELLQRFAS